MPVQSSHGKNFPLPIAQSLSRSVGLEHMDSPVNGYVASTENVDRFKEQLLEAVGRGDLGKVNGAVAAQIVHGYVQQDNATHTAEIIQALPYLEALGVEVGVDHGLLQQARKFAGRWSEWLVYPTDIESGLPGFSSRFTLNEHLDLHLFACEQAGT